MVHGDRCGMILIIQINNIPFHYYEFVKPIEDIIKQTTIPFTSLHYKEITPTLLGHADKIIIAGTSLKDNTYLQDVESFKWITRFSNPILGICGGMQLLATVHGEVVETGQEIGLQTITYHKPFLGEKEDQEVYALHNNYVQPQMFAILASSENYPQVIQHPTKPFYGVLFHPEVRNKQMITQFIKSQ